MKKLILMLCLMAGFSFLAGAQVTKKTPEQRAAHKTRALQKHLNLTQLQATKVNAAFLAQATRMDSLKSGPANNKKLNHLTARSIKLQGSKQVMAVLNDTQKQKFAAWEKMKKENHKDKKAQKDTQAG